MKAEIETVWQGQASIVVRSGGTDLEQGTLYLVVTEGGDAGDESAATMLPPEKARALAALLLKHADRAEGRGT